MDIYDMHCHVDLMNSMTAFADSALKESIGIFAVTTTPKAYEKESCILKPFPNIRVGLGLHPQLVSDRYDELILIEKYISMAVYIGEIGLDFNRQYYPSKEKQMDIFDNIIKWCGQYNGKIISIHAVHADKAVLDVIEKYACAEHNRCILHWFSGTVKQLQRAVEMGCLFSVNSAMLKSPNGQNIIRSIPSKSILLETDAPFIGDIKTAKMLKENLVAVRNKLMEYVGESLLQEIQMTSAALFAM